MSIVLRDTASLPGHLDLPDTDGKPLENSIEQIQNLILTSSLRPILDKLHPNEQYFIGHDVGIYFYLDPDDLLSGCRAPDWFYVPDTTPVEPQDGSDRRSYVMWKEKSKSPYLIIEQVSSNDGEDERDRTEGGKMWVYETKLKTPYYAIFEGFRKKPGEGKLEVYRLVNKKYVAQVPDANGRYLIPKLNVMLGIEDQTYQLRRRPWLRFYDPQGKLLPTSDERAKAEELARLEAEEKAKAEELARLEAEERATKAEAEVARLMELIQHQQRKPESE